MDHQPLHRLLSRLKLRQLSLLCALDEGASLRHAAGRLNLSQPAATRLLRDLEAALDHKLFERSPRGLSPTLVGEAMIRHARVLLADLDGARAELDSLAHGSSGRVSVGTLFSTAPVLVPRAIARVKSRQPLLDVFVREGTHTELIAALREGQLDLMLGRVVAAPGGGDVEVEVLYDEGFRIVCGPANPLRKRREPRLGAFIDAPWILPGRSTVLRQQLDIRFVQEAGRVPLDVVECQSFATNLALLRETSRLTIFPDEVARYYSRAGLVRELRVSLLGLLGPVALFFRPAKVRSRAAEGFISAVRATVQELRQ